MNKKIISGVVFCFFFLSCTSKKPLKLEDTDILLKNVNIVSMTTTKIHHHKNVVIRKEKIIRILSNKEITKNHLATVIDGKDKYLAPGLIDMHAHIPSPKKDSEATKEALFLYLANGVTSIRMMAGDLEYLKMRENIRSGELIGPRVFLSGPPFDKKSTISTAVIDSMVTAQNEMGYDFLKIRPGVSLSNFNFLINKAANVGMSFCGHVPTEVGLIEAMASGYTSIEHLDGFIQSMLPDSLHLNPKNQGYFGFNYINYANINKLNALVEQTVRYKVWNTPTQRLLEIWCFPGSSEELSKLPEMKFIPKERVEFWKERRDRELLEANFTIEKGKKYLELRRKIIKALNDTGYGLLAGTDPPQIFIVPGFSIHQEMLSFVNSGLSNYDAIKTATVNPAKFFNKEREFGQIIEGASADLVLLSKNPLENIQNYTSIQGVMYQGNWFSKETIDKGLKQIERKYIKE